ncbi:MAG: MBOAT family protein [Bacteroidales bacterium]|nr:MBOAT family protein [Bacteroidales bacterium]MCM1414492.1 MBOAT family protein [bacterium]MCM1423754.1 MBOAT family protein [bacterium]
MLFNSMTFAVFLIAVFFLYYFMPVKSRWLFLLLASYAFYMNLHAAYGLLLLFTTLLTFFLALALEKAPDAKKKRLCLASGILPLIGILLVLKLGAPAIDKINALIDTGRLSLQPLTLRILLPAGVSFYFFQSMGYLIDVYKGKIRAERHFGHYALFVSFFPQLLAGPIGRADALLPQLKTERRFDYDSASYGLKLMAWGYFKKLVIADTFAVTVNQVYGNCRSYVGLVFIITTVMYAIEIYCDFSGYSDIAIGCAALFGVKLATNFKSPYLSFSIREFWSRWHISLSSWFRDYVYIPLGGSRTGAFRHRLNLLITFLVSGFWHGSSLTYLIWGAIHGLYQIAETFLYPKRKPDEPARKKHWWQLPTTFATICFAWIFFRADSIQDAFWIISRLFWDIGRPLNYLKTAAICLDLSYPAMAGMALSAAALLVYDVISLKQDVIELVSRQKFFVRWSIYVLLLAVIALFSYKGIATEFIYFQF